MLALLGFATIIVFLILIMTKKMSVITALVIAYCFWACRGLFAQRIGRICTYRYQTSCSHWYFTDVCRFVFRHHARCGLFDPIIAYIIKTVKGDPLKVVVGTAILTMIVHLDGDGTATFMIVLSAFLPIYKQLKMSRLVLSSIVALSVGPMHLVPWSGTSARAISSLKSDAVHIFNPNIPSLIVGLVWVLFVAYIFGKKERDRLGIIELKYDYRQSLSPEQQHLRRPQRMVFNTILTLGLIGVLMKGWIPAPVLFVLASMAALLINYPKVADQQRILKSHGTNIFMVSSMIFAAGIFSGVLTGTQMIEEMANSLVSLIPQNQANLLPVLTALTSLPASMLFTPDAYYFGVVPILSQTATQFGIDSLEIGRAALLGQMTVGFPISPLTASTFLLVGLSEVDLGEHQRHTFWWAWGTTLVMTIVAIVEGSIHV
ncbi:MAG: citrate:proton symporter [Spirosomataceae bacterium]